MKNFNKACLAAGLFLMLSVFDACAMNKNKNLKRKERFDEEESDSSDFKKKKSLVMGDPYFEKSKNFSHIFDENRSIPLRELDPKSIKNTTACQNLSCKQQKEKNQFFLKASYFDINIDYCMWRSNLACAVVAGADPNFECVDSFELLYNVLRYSDCCLMWLLLLYGIDPNSKERSTGHTILYYVDTLEIATLLVNFGANTEYCNDLLVRPVKNGNWRLLKFYCDNKVQVNRNNFSPFLCFFDEYETLYGLVGYVGLDVPVNTIENYLRTFKILFLEGYRDTIKRQSTVSDTNVRQLLLKASQNKDFCLQQYLHFLKYHEIFEEEKNKMYNFAKNNNQTDMDIQYL